MTGEILKSILFRNGIQLKDVAEKLEMSQQNFSNALKVADIKTGLLEKLCDVLDVTLEFFYHDTKYSSSSIVQVTASGDQSIATNSGDVTFGGQNDNNGHIGVQNKNTQDKKDNVTTLTETVSTLTKELDTSQQQKSHLIEVVATSQKQIQQMTDIIDRLTK